VFLFLAIPSTPSTKKRKKKPLLNTTIFLLPPDMGHGELDDTKQVLKLEPPALDTTRNLIREMDQHDFVFHVGDLSYADGYEAIVCSS